MICLTLPRGSKEEEKSLTCVVSSDFILCFFDHY